MNSADPEILIVPEVKGIANPLFDSQEDCEAFRERFAKAVKERDAAYQKANNNWRAATTEGKEIAPGKYGPKYLRDYPTLTGVMA